MSLVRVKKVGVKLSGGLWDSQAWRPFCPYLSWARLQPPRPSLSSKGWIPTVAIQEAAARRPPEARLKRPEKFIKIKRLRDCKPGSHPNLVGDPIFEPLL